MRHKSLPRFEKKQILVLLFVLLPTHVLLLAGCGVLARPAMLPSEQEIIREQLVVHSNFHLPRHHRILDDLVARRRDISEQLGIPTSDEPIHIYLFSDAETFSDFMKRTHPAFPNRRAFFVKSDTTLMVYAYWGDRVAEDLRHEVTHGYLHSVVPNLPLWLDEGLAEYFETTRGTAGINRPHVKLLGESIRDFDWQPNLARLEQIEVASELTQLDYAESWLWVHFLLNEDAHTNSLLCSSLAEIRRTGRAEPLSGQVESYLPDADLHLVQHLKKIADAQ